MEMTRELIKDIKANLEGHQDNKKVENFDKIIKLLIIEC